MRWLFPLLFIGLAGCMSPVVLDYQEGVNFSRYQTFAVTDADGAESIDSTRVRKALTQGLMQEGLEQVPRSEADLLARHRFIEHSRYDTTDVFWGIGAGAGRGGIGLGVSTPVAVDERKDYQLVLELVDPRRQQVVWKAGSQRTLSADLGGARRAEWIQTVVKQMLERYPPGGEAS